MGNNKLKAGIVIKIKVNLDEASDRFNGKYLVARRDPPLQRGQQGQPRAATRASCAWPATRRRGT
jgi:hypothetical protein